MPGKAYVHLQRLRSFPKLPLKEIQCLSEWWWPFLILSRKIDEHFLSVCLSSSRWLLVYCPWPCAHKYCLEACQYFRSEMQGTCDGCFLSAVVSIDSSMSRTVHPEESSRVDVEHWHMPFWTSHFTFHFLQQAHWICEDDCFCGLTVHLLRQSNGTHEWLLQARGWDHIGCTVFVDGVATCLRYRALYIYQLIDWLIVKPHPDYSLVTELSLYTMESCSLLFSWIRSLISEFILHAGCSQQCLPKFLAGVSHRDAELSYLSTPWHAWALSADIPVDWILCLTHWSLHPFMPCKASWNGLRILYSTEIHLVNWLITYI